MDQKTPVSVVIEKNIARFKEIYPVCADIKMKEMHLGLGHGRTCFLAYIEIAVGNSMLETTALGRLLRYLDRLPETEFVHALDENAMSVTDLTPYDYVEDAAQGVLTGDAVLFVEGYNKALKIADRGYPGMPVTDSESEKTIRGSAEAFADSVKINTALIRKRVRSTRLRVKELICGTYSHTCVDLVYMEDLAYPWLVKEIEERLTRYEIDGVLDSGVLEQLAEENWYSPFPQFLTTQRPDRAAMAVLEGRVVVLSDNSPVALILPTDWNSFLKTTDDYYNRFEAATFARLLRYTAAFLAMTLPGFYLAVTNFHTQLLPTPLLLSFWEARLGVPFPAAVEVVFMELAFELLREAGVRLPGAMGSTIGIVGGLIIGQAAVDANLVSPIVVIVVAFTALCSFAIPNEEFAFSFRLIKFIFIFLSSCLGFFGFLVGLMVVLIHLSRLKSFGIPYMTPFVGPEINGYRDQRDFIWRFPMSWLTDRPVCSREKGRVRLRNRKQER